VTERLRALRERPIGPTEKGGRPLTVTGTGLLARCLQHETDHLDGILYVDRLPAADRATVLADADLDAALGSGTVDPAGA
jgi:peptide deformylase